MHGRSRYECRGPAWVAQVDYVRVRVVFHSLVHSCLVTVLGFEVIPLGPQALERNSQPIASSSTRRRLNGYFINGLWVFVFYLKIYPPHNLYLKPW